MLAFGLLSFLTLVIVPVSAQFGPRCPRRECPTGERCIANPFLRCVCTRGYVNCYDSPCRTSRCDNHPFAVCRDSYCGGCFADWYENGRIVRNCIRRSPLFIGRLSSDDS